VVGDDPQRAGRREVVAVLPARQLLAELDQRPEQVRLVHGRDALENARHALDAQAGVDVLRGQLGQRAVRLEVVLHEDEVPELEEALGVVARPVGVGPEVRSAVEVELRAGAAGTGRAGLPEVVVDPEQHDALVGDAQGAPVLDRLAVGSEPQLLVTAEDGDPDVVEGEPEPVLLRGGEVERELAGLPLEVVADREVPEHLEERQVPERRADDLDVNGAEGLLTGGQPPARRLLLAAEVRLEGLHARSGEQHRGVIGAGNERRRGHAEMAVLLEERQEPLPDFGSLHRRWSLGGGEA
jgi:hypothetical protein